MHWEWFGNDEVGSRNVFDAIDRLNSLLLLLRWSEGDGWVEFRIVWLQGTTHVQVVVRCIGRIVNGFSTIP